MSDIQKTLDECRRALDPVGAKLTDAAVELGRLTAENKRLAEAHRTRCVDLQAAYDREERLAAALRDLHTSVVSVSTWLHNGCEVRAAVIELRLASEKSRVSLAGTAEPYCDHCECHHAEGEHHNAAPRASVVKSEPHPMIAPVDADAGRDRIEACVREIQIICDHFNFAPEDWLQNEAATAAPGVGT